MLGQGSTAPLKCQGICFRCCLCLGGKPLSWKPPVRFTPIVSVFHPSSLSMTKVLERNEYRMSPNQAQQQRRKWYLWLLMESPRSFDLDILFDIFFWSGEIFWPVTHGESSIFCLSYSIWHLFMIWRDILTCFVRFIDAITT